METDTTSSPVNQFTTIIIVIQRFIRCWIPLVQGDDKITQSQRRIVRSEKGISTMCPAPYSSARSIFDNSTSFLMISMNLSHR